MPTERAVEDFGARSDGFVRILHASAILHPQDAEQLPSIGRMHLMLSKAKIIDVRREPRPAALAI
jgi:hypothetical protein